MLEITIIIAQSLIIMALLVDRYLYTKEMVKQLSNATKAVLSRNVNEYIAAVTAEKTSPMRPEENDEVLLSDLPDDAFDEIIRQENK